MLHEMQKYFIECESNINENVIIKFKYYKKL